jgi:formylglycine-generating enzyme required for sulfatase activity
MVSVPAPDGGTYCIDSTEVTNAQYAAFLLAKNGDTSGQPAVCSWNNSYADFGDAGGCADPSVNDPVARGQYPVQCVDWCDANAFCAWAGKQLCGGFVANDPGNSGWGNACSSDGKFTYPYGSTYVPGRCIDRTFDAAQPVASAAGCQSPDPAYAGVFDLSGNVAEFVEVCQGQTGPTDTCALQGGCRSCDMTTLTCFNGMFSLQLNRDIRVIELGFRCCSGLR